MSSAYMRGMLNSRIGVDDEEADAAVGELGLGEQRADDGDAKPEPHAVDDRMAHRRQVDLGHHLPGEARKLWPTRISTGSIGRMPATDAERDREEARDRAHRDLRAAADAEPHDHDRERR